MNVSLNTNVHHLLIGDSDRNQSYYMPADIRIANHTSSMVLNAICSKSDTRKESSHRHRIYRMRILLRLQHLRMFHTLLMPSRSF